MARQRFAHYSDAEKRCAIERYRKEIAAGVSGKAAARRVGVSSATIEKWLHDSAAPVAVKPKQRLCLGGCGKLIKSTGPGHRLCPSCGGRFAKLPAQWSA